MRVYCYLRASSKDQDAQRAKQDLIDFCEARDFEITAWFMENESGATLKRPELFRLLDIAQRGDIMLVEQIDRISRLNTEDWERLKKILSDKGIKIVSLDLPTSHNMLANTDAFTERMLSALNSMMLDMLAAIARKDYEDRKRRQMQGIAKARKEGKFRGRQPNQKLRDNISVLLDSGRSYSEIVNLLNCSRATISSVKKAGIQAHASCVID